MSQDPMRPWHFGFRAIPRLVSFLILAGCPGVRSEGSEASLPERLKDDDRPAVAAKRAQDAVGGKVDRDGADDPSELAGKAGSRPPTASAQTITSKTGSSKTGSSRTGSSDAGSSPSDAKDPKSGSSVKKVAREPAGTAREVTPPRWLHFAAEHDIVRLRSKRVTKAEVIAIRARLGRRIRLRKVTFYEAVKDEVIVAVAYTSAEVGRHGVIRYVAYLGPEGSVTRVQVTEQHEVRGASVSGDRFLSQFVGKSADDKISVGVDVDAISGATISSKALTRGVRKAIVLWESIYK